VARTETRREGEEEGEGGGASGRRGLARATNQDP
jgi:hypothetical protein